MGRPATESRRKRRKENMKPAGIGWTIFGLIGIAVEIFIFFYMLFPF